MDLPNLCRVWLLPKFRSSQPTIRSSVSGRVSLSLSDSISSTSRTISFFIQQCADIFGDKFNLDVLNNGVAFTNAYYGGFGLKPTRVAFPNGSIDPWHALGITNQTGLSDDSVAIFIQGTAHCADMYPTGDDDLIQLTQARQQIVQFLANSLASD